MEYVTIGFCLLIAGLIGAVIVKKFRKSEKVELVRDPNMMHAEVEVRDQNMDLSEVGKVKKIKKAKSSKKVAKKKTSKKRK